MTLTSDHARLAVRRKPVSWNAAMIGSGAISCCSQLAPWICGQLMVIGTGPTILPALRYGESDDSASARHKVAAAKQRSATTLPMPSQFDGVQRRIANESSRFRKR